MAGARLGATRPDVSSLLKSPPVQAALAWAGASYLTLASATQSWRVEGEEHLRLMAEGSPLIVAFWHETLPSMPIFWRRAKRMGMTRPGTALASRHRDGQMIGRVLGHFGIGLVSGSSSRGGAAGLRGLLRALEQGHNVALTPDGPRGPRHVAARGVAQLAALSGAAILPCAAATSRAKTISSWDEMRLPLPFGRGVLVCGAPIFVPRANWQEALPQIEAALNAALAQARLP